MNLLGYVSAHSESVDWVAFSSNPSLTEELIRAHPALPWSGRGLCRNRSLSWHFLKEHGYLLDSYSAVRWCRFRPGEIGRQIHITGKYACNPNISMIELLGIAPRFHQACFLSRNPHLTLHWIKAFQRRKILGEWNWTEISYSAKLSIEDLRLNRPWNWSMLSQNKHLSVAEMLEHPEFPWDWAEVSYNPTLTREQLFSHPEKPWNWSALSQSPAISFSYILEHPEKPWNWDLVCRNPNLRLYHVLAHPDHPWNWSILLTHLPIFSHKEYLQALCFEWKHHSTSYFSLLQFDLFTYYLQPMLSAI